MCVCMYVYYLIDRFLFCYLFISFVAAVIIAFINKIDFVLFITLDLFIYLFFIFKSGPFYSSSSSSSASFLIYFNLVVVVLVGWLVGVS